MVDFGTVLEQFLAEISDRDIMWPLLGSLIAGALIGSEREYHGKAAGLRTHTLVCFAAGLMTLVGLRMSHWHGDLPAGAQIVTDMARMPHAILTGVGFLGAGVIFRDGLGVQGLTTAATLWLTAALGVVFGTGELALAMLGTVIALVVLVLLRLVQRFQSAARDVGVELTVPVDSGLTTETLERVLRDMGLVPTHLAVTHDLVKQERHYRLILGSREDPPASDKVLQGLAGQGLVHRFVWSDRPEL